MDNLTPLESYVLAQEDSFQAISSVVKSFSSPDQIVSTIVKSFISLPQDKRSCYFPSKAFVTALLQTADDKIWRLLAQSAVSSYVFECAIDSQNKAYIEKYFDKANFYLNGKQIIALFELGCKNIAEKFLKIWGFMSRDDADFIEYLKRNNYKCSFIR